MTYCHDMTKLVGRTISSIKVSDDQTVLAFETDDGLVCFEVDADCCSESWFADIIGVRALLGSKVVSAASVALDGYNVEDGRGRQEVDEAYGFKIVTDKGTCDVIFRNSSNGYYGGSLTSYDKALPEKMIEIVDDWQA